MARQREPKNAAEPEGLGVLVRAAREQRGWSQAELGELIGIDKSFVSAIEVGARKWPRKYVQQIAEVLGLDLVELAIAADVLPEEARRVRTKSEAYPIGDPAREVMQLIDGMDQETRQALRDYARFLTETRKPRAAD